MSANWFKKFMALYKKQMREILPEIIVVAAVAVVISLVLYYKVGAFPPAIGFPVVMLIGLAGFLPLISSLRLSQEWSNHTIYLMMSLPVGGGMILGSRLAALLTQYLLGTVMAGLSGLLLTLALFPEAFSYVEKILPYWGHAALMYLISMASLAYLLAISLFSQVAGKLVNRFSGLVTALVFIITLWLSGKVMELMWAPGTVELRETTLSLLSSVLGQILLVTALIFALAVMVYNRRVEL